MFNAIAVKGLQVVVLHGKAAHDSLDYRYKGKRPCESSRDIWDELNSWIEDNDDVEIVQILQSQSYVPRKTLESMVEKIEVGSHVPYVTLTIFFRILD